ncbi:MAG TPA: SpoIID/LytB domain-containing protein [Candidatus Onthousia faecavium]|nr:SpoIID/LytB domain-containing protein [Candidatus Onthousia faecavium]
MLNSYKIVRTMDEEILYLYLDINYEFARELSEDSLKQKATNYLITHDIKFKGNKVIFVINGVEAKAINLNKYKIYLNKDLFVVDNKEKMTLKEILLSLLFSNLSIDLEIEALKAITVLYRSEVISNLKDENLNLLNISLAFHNYNYYKLTYKETYKEKVSIYNRAIDETDGEYLLYNNKPIKCYTHLVSNGYTEENPNIPYTVRKESLWDLTYPNYMQVKSYKTIDFKKKLNIDRDDFNLKITSISNSNRIKELEIGDRKIEASLLAVYLDLPSTDITIIVKKDYLTFVTRGIGSGLGLSIIGADNLAELGFNYRQILNYYFKEVSLVVKEAQ